MLPKTTPCQTMLGKIEKLMPPGKAINFTKIPDKLLPWVALASLFPKCSPRQPLAKPCWEKLGKWCPLSGPSILQRFLIRFCRGFAFSKTLPKTTLCKTMLGKVGKMMPHVRASIFTKIPVKLLPRVRFFQNAPQDNPLPNHVAKSCENDGP